jgi:hypothetical protein
MNTHDIELPPLPHLPLNDPAAVFKTVHDWGRAAIAHDRQQRGEPVAQVAVNGDGSQVWIALKTQWLPKGRHNLYAEPQPAEPVTIQTVASDNSGLTEWEQRADLEAEEARSEQITEWERRADLEAESARSAILDN